MSLFDKITHFGYEVEYPLTTHFTPHDVLDYLEDYDMLEMINDEAKARGVPDAFEYWDLHHDCGGVEFTVVTPQDSMDALKREVTKIYDFIDELVGTTRTDTIENPYYDEDPDSDDYITYETEFSTVDSYFNGRRVGVHIRIDVTDWETVEKLRFMRLFSFEFDKVQSGRASIMGVSRDDAFKYIAWMQDNVLHRDWHNWNHPFNYADYWRDIYNGYSTPTKTYNVQYESNYLDTWRDTIEIRGYGVNRDLDDALVQLDSIKVLCDIVDESLKLDGDTPVLTKLVYAWKKVTGVDDLPDWDEFCANTTDDNNTDDDDDNE